MTHNGSPNSHDQDGISSSGRGLSRRAITNAGIWSIPVVGVAIAAPAQAASGNPQLSAVVLGYSNTNAESPSEFRLDYYVDVPNGVRPRATEYLFRPNNSGDSSKLGQGTQASNVRAVVDQNWGVIATRRISAQRERIYLHLRGDANVDYASTSRPAIVNGNWQAVFKWSNGATDTPVSLPMQDPTLAPGGGRPLGINAWDRRTDEYYPTANQQSGWAVPSKDGTVLYSQFVMAAGSRRLVASGGDRANQVYYQFQNTTTGSTWTHLGVNTAPQLIDVAGGSAASPGNTSPGRIINSGALGLAGDRCGPRLSLALGLGIADRFTLPDEGYWQLLVWPQAASSAGIPVPNGVSWDPATEAGHQIGSIYYFSPTSGTSFNSALTEIAP